jgi:MFS family permease
MFSAKKTKISLAILYSMTFFLSLATALPAYVQSSYLESFVGLAAVNWFFISANLISILLTLVFPRLIKKLGNYLTTGAITLVFFGALAGLGLSHNPGLIFLFFVIMQVASNLVLINMDLFIEDFSKNSSTGETRTIYFTILNLAWIISPTLSAWLINSAGYYSVFLVSAGLLLPFLLILTLSKCRINIDFKYDKKFSIIQIARKMFKNKDLKNAFGLALLLNVFYNATTVFIPIYLNRIVGFSWSELGLLFSIMLVPFLIVEIPAGIISDKYIGEKEMFTAGFFIMIICLVLFFVTDIHSFWIWAILLFASRVGAALVEAMRESYFFKKVSAREVDKINIFRTAIPVGYLVGSLLSAITLIFLPLSYIFPVTAIVLCSSFFFLFFIKDTK